MVLGQKKKNNPIIKLLHNVSQDSIWQANKAKKKYGNLNQLFLFTF